MTVIDDQSPALDAALLGEMLRSDGSTAATLADEQWTALGLAALDGAVPDWLQPTALVTERLMSAARARAWISSAELAATFETHRAERDNGQADGRRNTGAYFTPPELVQFLVDRSLAPVLARAHTADEVLSLRILDPAVGTGVFLVEAGRQLASHLVRVTGMPDAEARAAVVRSCLRGVDAHQVSALLAAAVLATFGGDPEAAARAVRWADFVLPPTTLELRPGAAPALSDDAWAHDCRSDFDVVIGNPPWGTVKPAIREFLAGAEPTLLDAHGAELKDRVRERPQGARLWSTHAEEVRAYARALRTSGWYAHQGRGDADLYRYFVERAHGLLRDSGARLGFLVPSALLRADGASPLRQLLLSTGTVEEVTEFINSKRLFKIHSMFRFVSVIWTRGHPGGIHRASFGATSINDAVKPTSPIRMDPEFLAEVGGGRLTVPDVRHPRDVDLLKRLYQAHPLMGDDDARRRPIRFVRELDMTNDSRLFVRAGAESTTHDGVPLYEGRMVHQFDDRAKRFVGGSGRRAEWSPQVLGRREIAPQFLVAREVADRARPSRNRAGFCDVTGHANERSVLAGLIPATAVAGNKVPTVRIGSDDDTTDHLIWIALANSFVIDWIARRRISTSLNFFHLNQLPFPDLDAADELGGAVAALAGELANGVAEWDHNVLSSRARTRARLDVLVASSFGLGIEDVVHILDDFPLLDRHQPPLASGQRSTITRDLLLATFADHAGQTINDLRDLGIEVPAGPIDLGERIDNAVRAGQIAYVPGEMARQLWRRA